MLRPPTCVLCSALLVLCSVHGARIRGTHDGVSEGVQTDIGYCHHEWAFQPRGSSYKENPDCKAIGADYEVSCKASDKCFCSKPKSKCSKWNSNKAYKTEHSSTMVQTDTGYCNHEWTFQPRGSHYQENPDCKAIGADYEVSCKASDKCFCSKPKSKCSKWNSNKAYKTEHSTIVQTDTGNCIHERLELEEKLATAQRQITSLVEQAENMEAAVQEAAALRGKLESAASRAAEAEATEKALRLEISGMQARHDDESVVVQKEAMNTVDAIKKVLSQERERYQESKTKHEVDMQGAHETKRLADQERDSLRSKIKGQEANRQELLQQIQDMRASSTALAAEHKETLNEHQSTKRELKAELVTVRTTFEAAERQRDLLEDQLEQCENSAAEKTKVRPPPSPPPPPPPRRRSPPPPPPPPYRVQIFAKKKAEEQAKADEVAAKKKAEEQAKANEIAAEMKERNKMYPGRYENRKKQDPVTATKSTTTTTTTTTTAAPQMKAEFYGRGWGTPWILSDGVNYKVSKGKQLARCKRENGGQNCEICNRLAFPKCKKGYTANGCNICRKKDAKADEVAAEKKAEEQAKADELAAKKKAEEQTKADDLAAKKKAEEQAKADEVAAKKKAEEQAKEQAKADELAAKKKAKEQAKANELAAKNKAEEQAKKAEEQAKMRHRRTKCINNGGSKTAFVEMVVSAEKVKFTGVCMEKGFLYFLGKDGNVWRSGMSRGGVGYGAAEKVANAGVTRESGFRYYIDKDGDVSRAPMASARGRG